MQTPSPSRILPWRRAALLLWPALLVACGGGGGGSADTGGSQAISPAVGASAPVAATATCGLPDFQAAAMARINYHRARGASCPLSEQGTPVQAFPATTPLAWNSKLTQAAAAHSADMVALNYFSHTSADGRLLQDRIDATGYAWNTIGENIAAGVVYNSVDAVVDAWVGHVGHCQNVMNPDFTEVGLACNAGTTANTYRNYWTMDLARSR